MRLAACQAFESLATARLSMIRRANNLPSLKNAKEGLEKTPAEITKDITLLDPFIARELPQVETLLKDPDIMIRRAAAEILEKAAEIKARFRLSLADAWIAASALLLDAVLVHKDPEFERVDDLRQELLPYK